MVTSGLGGISLTSEYSAVKNASAAGSGVDIVIRQRGALDGSQRALSRPDGRRVAVPFVGELSEPVANRLDVVEHPTVPAAFFRSSNRMNGPAASLGSIASGWRGAPQPLRRKHNNEQAVEAREGAVVLSFEAAINS